MDSRFMEDDSDGNENDDASQKQTEMSINVNNSDNIETNQSDERQWQLNILESVIGKKVQTNSKKTQKK